MIRCALIVALAAPPAGSAVPWGPLPGGASPASTPVASASPGAPATPIDSTPPGAPVTPVPAASPEAVAPPAPASMTHATGLPVPVAPVRPPPPGMGTLVLTGEGQGGDVTVRDAGGETVAAVTVAAGQSIGLHVPAGEYTVENGAGAAIGATIAAGQGARVVVRPGVLSGGTLVGPAPGTVLRVGEPPVPRTHWRRPVAPLLSAVIPGLGQMVNREYARGAGFLLGSVSLGAVAYGLWRARGGLDAAAPGEHGRTYSTEVIGAAGLGVLTAGLHTLYMAQVLDAYAGASGKRSPTPHTKHKVSLELTRMATVGLRAGDPAAQLYADWNLGIVGQVARRFSVGLTDLGLKFGPSRAVVQGGVRLSYRFVERGRVWFGGAAGAIVQGAFASGLPQVVPEGTPAPRTAVAAVIPYGQLDLRIFILDRWSINVVPRISAPLVGARYYRGDGAIPKQAVTLELGTGLGVYF